MPYQVPITFIRLFVTEKYTLELVSVKSIYFTLKLKTYSV